MVSLIEGVYVGVAIVHLLPHVEAANDLRTDVRENMPQ